MRGRRQVVAQNVDRLRAGIPDSRQVQEATASEPRASLPQPSGNSGPEAALPISGLARRIQEAQANVAGVQKIRHWRGHPDAGEAREVRGHFRRGGMDAAIVEREVRNARNQHQRQHWCTRSYRLL